MTNDKQQYELILISEWGLNHNRETRQEQYKQNDQIDLGVEWLD